MSILIRTASFKATVLCAALAGLVSAAQAETAAAPQVPGPADAVNQLIVKLRAVKTPPGATAAKAERADVQAVIDRVLAARSMTA